MCCDTRDRPTLDVVPLSFLVALWVAPLAEGQALPPYYEPWPAGVSLVENSRFDAIQLIGPMNTDGLSSEFLTYRADLTQPRHGTRHAKAFQWAESPIRVSFYARPEIPEARLQLTAILRGIAGQEEATTTTLSLDPPAEEYEHVVWDVEPTGFAVEEIELRIFALDAGKIWLDFLRITDDLEWLSEGTEPPIYARTDEGYLTKNGAPHFPRILWWGNAAWRDPNDLDDAFGALADRGFSGVFAPPRQGDPASYSRRGLRVFLDTAECHGLEVIAHLPIFPCCPGGDWPKERVLVESWVGGFSDHPALFGWLLRDEVTLHQIRDLPPSWPVRDWVRAAEDDPDRFHPLLAYTSEGPFVAPWTWSDSLHFNTYDCLQYFHGNVDIIAPNMLPIQNNLSGNNPRRRYSIATRLAKSSAMQARLTQPGDVPMIMPSIQVEPAHCNTRSPSAVDVGGMVAQAALEGASGVLFWKAYWDLAAEEEVTPPGQEPEYGKVANGYPDPDDGCDEGDDPEYREFRLLIADSRELWEDRDASYGLPGQGDTVAGGAQSLWQDLPTIFEKATQLFQKIYAKTTGDGFERELIYDDGADVEVVDGYVKSPSGGDGESWQMQVGGRGGHYRSMLRFESDGFNANYGTDCDTRVRRAVLRTLLLHNQDVPLGPGEDAPLPPGDEGEDVALNLFAAELPAGFDYWSEGDISWTTVGEWLDNSAVGLMDWDTIVAIERMEKHLAGQLFYDHVYLEFDLTDLFCQWASSTNPNSGLFIQPDFRRQLAAYYAVIGTEDWPPEKQPFVSPHLEIHSYPADTSGPRVESFEVAADFAWEVGADLYVLEDWDSADRNEAWLAVTNPANMSQCLQVYSGQVDTTYLVQGYDLWRGQPRAPYAASWKPARNCSEYGAVSCECVSTARDTLWCGEESDQLCWYYFGTKILPWETRLLKVCK